MEAAEDFLLFVCGKSYLNEHRRYVIQIPLVLHTLLISALHILYPITSVIPSLQNPPCITMLHQFASDLSCVSLSPIVPVHTRCAAMESSGHSRPSSVPCSQC